MISVIQNEDHNAIKQLKQLYSNDKLENLFVDLGHKEITHL